MKKDRERAIILMRDGVINRRAGIGCVRDWQQFDFLPGALKGLRLLAEYKFTVLVIANQDSLEKGQRSPNELRRVTQRMLLEVALAGGNIEKVHCRPDEPYENRYCPTPLVGLLMQAITEHGLCVEETYLVSDSAEDLVVGKQIGCPTVELRRDAFLNEGLSASDGHHEIASNLYEAAERIVSHGFVTFEGALREERQEAGPEPQVCMYVHKVTVDLSGRAERFD
jgi:D-glycero-D-manno-heptose 1,7-bisphosphate phosphatase